jgi:lipase chaperone LimK
MIKISSNKSRVFIVGATLFTVLAYIMSEAELNIVPHAVESKAAEVETLTSVNSFNIAFDTSTKASFPPSLKGTSHGVTLTVNQDDLVITASLKDLFDYYLSTSGEENFEQINRRIIFDLSSQLTALALEQALVIWENYVAYKTALVSFEEQYSMDANILDQYQHLDLLQQRQLSLVALQDQIFSKAVAQILFSFDRQLDQYTLEKARVLASGISDEAKQQTLLNLNEQLPIEVAISMKRNEQQKRLLEIDTMSELTSTQRYNLRTQHVGEAAANRLQLLDDKRLLWKKRVDDFLMRKQNLLKAELAGDDYLVSLDKLYQQSFSPDELLRAKALTQQP